MEVEGSRLVRGPGEGWGGGRVLRLRGSRSWVEAEAFRVSGRVRGFRF